MKILLVEDDLDLRNSIQAHLSGEGHSVDTAGDYMTGFNKSLDTHYDCLLVDLNIPGGNGLSLIKTIKKYKPATGVIIISGKSSIDDKITGLDMGADDYLAKPFHIGELSARIKSLTRRISQAGSEKIEVGLIKINPEAQTVIVNEHKLSLTPKEYELLLFFIHNKERVLSKESIATRLWREEDANPSYDFIYTHIKNLRKKLSEAGCSKYIQAVYGTGYRFSVS